MMEQTFTKMSFDLFAASHPDAAALVKDRGKIESEGVSFGEARVLGYGMLPVMMAAGNNNVFCVFVCKRWMMTSDVMSMALMDLARSARELGFVRDDFRLAAGRAFVESTDAFRAWASEVTGILLASSGGVMQRAVADMERVLGVMAPIDPVDVLVLMRQEQVSDAFNRNLSPDDYAHDVFTDLVSMGYDQH